MPGETFPETIGIPEEHKRVLNQRLADYESGKSKPISHEELMLRVHSAAKEK